MPHALRNLFLAIGIVAFAAPRAIAATPSSGTLSPLTPSLTFAGGPFTGANPTNNIPGSNGPDCSAVPNTCDDYLLTLSIPAGYSALHPNDVITVKVQWPNASINDFDVYILDSVTGASAQAPAATSSDPEITSWGVVDGTVTYRVRIGVFQAVNESYLATVTLGPPGAATPGVGQYAIGTDQWSCNQHLGADTPTGPPPVFDHNLDGEPAVKFDGNGKFYVSAIAGVPAGSGLWSTNDGCGQAYSFYGAPDAGLGGGDTELETAPDRNVLGNYNVYMSSLTLANLTSAVSFDGGNNFLFTPISNVTPVDDRQWNATYGANICYLSYRQGATQPGNFLECTRLDYTGMGAPVIAPASVVWLGLDPTLPRELGNMVTDRRPGANVALLTAGPNGEGNVYHGWTEEGHKVFVSVSHDFATTWTHHLVWDGGVGSSYNHKFTWSAVDQAGNVYTTFSDDRNVYLSISQDQGVTWSRPVRVNRGGASNIAIYPQIAAGSSGRVVITFYGHSGTSSQDASADWKVFVSRCQNSLAATPLFEEVLVSNRSFHSGPVCEQGLACSCCRELTECFDIDIDPNDGSAALAYGTFAVAGTYISRQVSGASAIAGKAVVDHSVDCPTPANNCNTVTATRRPCVLPGDLVVTDPTGTADTPPVANQQQDIESISIAEPAGIGDKLVLTMKVTSLNLSSLPPDAFWRIIWQGPGTGTANQHYVDVVNCATGGLSSHYGHFTTGSVQDGLTDAFSLSPDGTIQITIAKSKVGSPVPGTLLSAVNGDARDIIGTCPVMGTAAFAPIDVTNSGQYVVVGNDYCLPLQVTCERDAMVLPGDHTVRYTVTNPSTATRTVVASINDSNGWLVGGASFTAIPALGPGQSVTVTKTLRLPPDCAPRPLDHVTWTATDSDLPGSVECVTNYTCSLPTPTLVERFEAATAGDGVDLVWSTAAVEGVAGWNLYRGPTPETATERVNPRTIPVSGATYRYHDPSVPGGDVCYRLSGVHPDGTEAPFAETFAHVTPLTFSLGLAGPNPFRGATTLRYSLAERSAVRIEVLNVVGQRVRTLVDQEAGPGSYQVPFALIEASGRRLAPGTYLVRMVAGKQKRGVFVVGLN